MILAICFRLMKLSVRSRLSTGRVLFFPLRNTYPRKYGKYSIQIVIQVGLILSRVVISCQRQREGVAYNKNVYDQNIDAI